MAFSTLGDRTSPSTAFVGTMTWRLPNGSTAGNIPITGPTGTMRLTVGSVEGQALRAGDTIGVRLQRNGSSVNDVCASSVYVYGAELRF